MNNQILIACEYSGIVRDAFTKVGFDAVSCDLLPTESPGKHIQGDVIDILSSGWLAVIAFPPCTYLTRAQTWMVNMCAERKEHEKQALHFVIMLMSAPAKHIAIENPLGAITRYIRQPDQIYEPWQFGAPYHKKTCLWLKNLPPLISTCYSLKRKSISNHVNGRMSQEQKSKIRSRFFPEVAEAMANQWKDVIIKK